MTKILIWILIILTPFGSLKADDAQNYHVQFLKRDEVTSSRRQSQGEILIETKFQAEVLKIVKWRKKLAWVDRYDRDMFFIRAYNGSLTVFKNEYKFLSADQLREFEVLVQEAADRWSDSGGR